MSNCAATAHRLTDVHLSAPRRRHAFDARRITLPVAELFAPPLAAALPVSHAGDAVCGAADAPGATGGAPCDCQN